MSEDLPTRTYVKVGTRRYPVMVRQRSKTVWEASGRVQGIEVCEADGGRISAIRRWQESAIHRLSKQRGISR